MQNQQKSNTKKIKTPDIINLC